MPDTAPAAPAAPTARAEGDAARVVWAGVVALAVAMGIGRFAFTPLLPLMLRDGTLDAAGGAEWAAANYAGYLVGALWASRFAAHPVSGLRSGVFGVAASTLLVAWFDGPWAGALWRFAAGVFSAWSLVCTSSWCLQALARSGRAARGAWIYCGVGLGIALAGAIAWLGGRQPAAWLWLELGVLAALGALLVAHLIGTAGASTATAPASSPAPPSASSALSTPTPTSTSTSSSSSSPSPSPSTHAVGSAPRARQRALVFCYGSFGFGYIVPATFLPTMAREQAADPLIFGLTWPLFGSAAALSVALAARHFTRWPRTRVWAAAQATMGLGTALVLATQALWALALCALLVGGTFMVTTMAGLQLARERAPANPTALLARMTAAFAAGQIAGPLFVRAVGTSAPLGLDAMGWAHATATLLLGATAVWLARSGAARGHGER
ncbi:MAG: YbfB/YjiJ family MFS transporter [Proteobacteria bacterium]|nr:YbfB/YjiJ family MFS transporter [Pseudomonadota bacterium]